MHILMIGTDYTMLTNAQEASRLRHEAYAERLGGQISIVICNRRNPQQHLSPYRSDRLAILATESSGYAAYVRDGMALSEQFHAQAAVQVITSQDPFLSAIVGLRARRRFGAPLIIQDHSLFLSSPYFVREKPRNRLLRLIAQFTMPRADAIRVVNTAERAMCLKLGIPASKICVIPLGVELSAFRTQTSREQQVAWRSKLNIPLEAPLVLWVGRPVPVKNIPLLLDVFKRIHLARSDAHFVLVGDMTGTTYISMAAAMGLGEAIHFTGALPNADLPPLYQTANLFVLSSNYEGLGRVLLEAGAAGVPIVSTDQAGASGLVIPSVTGKLAPVGHAEKLANAALSLLNDLETAQRLSKAMQTHILKAYNPDQLAEKWVNMWRSVAKGEGPCAS